MTPADLAAALGVDVGNVRPQGDGTFHVGFRTWWLRDHTVSTWDRRPRGGISIDYPITTALPAAVAHVRAMLAAGPKEPTP